MKNSPMPLEGKIALITGAARSIGAATARELAARGAQIIIHHRSQAEAAARLAGELDGTSLQADLADPKERARLIQEVNARFDRLDILVNNAAGYQDDDVLQVDVEAAHAQLEVNAIAPLDLVGGLAPLMRPGGRVIHLSSIAASRPSRKAVYAASKAALESITRSQALVLGPRGITVNAVAPGTTMTETSTWLTTDQQAQVAASTALGRIGQAEDIARVVAMLAGPDSGWITGQTIHADGGLS